ncbi:hypothetical protein RB600_002069 [Gaeumannomyces tritici]
MKFPLLSLLGLAGSALSSSAAAAAAAEPPTAAILFTIPASHAVPNPNALTAATRATLSARGGPSLSAPLTASNGFVFPRVPPGSYLLDVHSGSHAFAPLRVDVAPAGAGIGAASAGRKQEPQRLAISAWETFRGNDWGNKGEAARRAEDGGGAFEVRCLGRKEYYMERSSFSVLSILKNPMILLAMVSMGIFLGMPYLLENSKLIPPFSRSPTACISLATLHVTDSCHPLLSGPRSPRRVRVPAEEQPDERGAGRRRPARRRL